MKIIYFTSFFVFLIVLVFISLILIEIPTPSKKIVEYVENPMRMSKIDVKIIEDK